MTKEKNAYIYILTNQYNTVLYVGVTSDLSKRIYQHKTGCTEGFSKKYNLHKLLYYECTDSIVEAVAREKYLKGKSREFKVNLIKTINPDFVDMSLDFHNDSNRV